MTAVIYDMGNPPSNGPLVGGSTSLRSEKAIFQSHKALLPYEAVLLSEKTPLTNPSMDRAVRSRTIKAIGQTLRKCLQSPEFSDVYNDNNSFFVCDLGEVYRLFNYWRYKLPRVEPHYAIKCNTDLQMIRLLADLGAAFDCASRVEMETVLRMGVTPDRIIFSNPCKFNSHLRYARDVGVNLTVFDNEDELVKIKQLHPDCQALLRIETDDKAAVVRLSSKYGAHCSSFDSLLHKAKELDINLVGVHFHCGAGSEEVDSIIKAVKDARFVFDKAVALGFKNMNVLDIGGGFMVNMNFDNVAATINTALETHFPLSMGVRVISEPGRFFATSAFTLASSIIGKRGSFSQNSLENERPKVYINDGIYANMNCIINDHYTPVPKVLSHNNEFKFYEEVGFETPSKPRKHFKVEVWGQTCDSADFVTKNAVVSYPLKTNDWLFFQNMGAYTLAAATSFNGFSQHSRIVYISSEENVRLNQSEDWTV